MSNPRGEIFGDADYIVAEAPDGTRFAHDAVAVTCSNGVSQTAITSARLEELAAHLNKNKPELNMNHWREIEARYGSKAYVDGDWEYLEIAREYASGGLL